MKSKEQLDSEMLEALKNRISWDEYYNDIYERTFIKNLIFKLQKDIYLRLNNEERTLTKEDVCAAMLYLLDFHPAPTICGDGAILFEWMLLSIEIKKDISSFIEGIGAKHFGIIYYIADNIIDLHLETSEILKRNYEVESITGAFRDFKKMQVDNSIINKVGN